MTDERDATDDGPSTEADADAGEHAGTFLVTEADEGSAVVRDVETGQVHALSENPGLDASEVLEATIAPEPPLEVSWSVVTIEDRRTIPIEESPEPPTSRTQEIADDQAVGEVTRVERAGTGEVHVLTVQPERTGAAVADVRDDEATRERAARLGVDRVEVRAAGGVLGVRYLP